MSSESESWCLKVHSGQFLQSVFSFVFSGYVSRCSALTHMFPQACNMLHRATSPASSLPWLSPISLAGWPNHLWQAEAFHAALWVCVEPVEPVGRGCSQRTKEQGHTGASSVRQAATVCSGFTCCPSVWAAAAIDEGGGQGGCCFLDQLPQDLSTSNCETLFYPKNCYLIIWYKKCIVYWCFIYFKSNTLI